jgi:putative hydrolase of the HAD superfamily
MDHQGAFGVAAAKAVISDFGGVLTTPLQGSFDAFEQRSGVPLPALGAAMAAVGLARGENPLHALETGRLTEADFLDALGAQLTFQLGRAVSLDGFGESFFGELSPNAPFLDYLRQLRGRGLRMGICTNNVREWSARWQAMIPVSEIFDVVVDSSQVGARKPDPRIYEVVLAELSVAAAEAVFIDDMEVNCTAAGELGLRPVWFRSTEQAIADTEAALGAHT